MSIFDVLPRDTFVRRVGPRQAFARCPLHEDKTASMSIRLKEKWLFYCFGCHATGTVIDLAMKLYGLSFKDACSKLSEGRVFDLTITTPTRPTVPTWTLVCDAGPHRRELSGDLVTAICRAEQLGWYVSGDGARVLCPACVEARLSDPHWHASFVTSVPKRRAA